MATSKKIKTSFTTTVVSRFEKNAKEGEQLGCESITGFSLFKKREASTKTLKSGEVKPIRAHVVYRMRYSDSGGKRRVVKIGSTSELHPQQAAEIAIQWRTGLVKGEADPLTKKREKAEQAAAKEQDQAQRQYLQLGKFYKDIYCEAMTDSPAVLDKIRLAFGHLFDRDMDKLTAQDIDDWYYKNRAERTSKDGEKLPPLKRTTLVGYFGALKAMLNYAAGQRRDIRNPNPVIDANPLTGYTLPRLTREERKAANKEQKAMLASRDIFTSEVKTAIQVGLDRYAEELREQRRRSRKHGKKHLPDLDAVAFPHWFIPFTHIARLTGMRPGDIYALTWEDIDFNPFNGKYTLIYTPRKTMHKGDEPITVKFPFGTNHPFIDVIEQWREQSGSPKTGLLFKSERTGRELERKAHLKHWTHVKALGGVPENLQFYSFRHNFISDLVRQGIAPEQIRKLVGHADTTMISRNYMRAADKDMEELATLSAESWQEVKPNKAKAALAAETWTEQTKEKPKAGNAL